MSRDTEQPGPRPAASDEDAARLAVSVNDPDRFGEIFDRYFPDIHGYVARRLGRDIADDVAADTFLTAFRARHRFDPDRGTVRSWLYGIATNHPYVSGNYPEYLFSSCAIKQTVVIGSDGMPMAEELSYTKLPAGADWTVPDGLFSYEIFQTPYWTNQNPPKAVNPPNPLGTPKPSPASTSPSKAIVEMVGEGGKLKALKKGKNGKYVLVPVNKG